MATTNLYSNVYIADSSGANKVYMDVNPSPMPDIPTAKRTVISTLNLAGLSGTTYTAGKTTHYDGGADVSGTEISWACNMAIDATITALKTKYDRIENVLFSLDNGVNVYEAVWVSLDYPRGEGRRTRNLTVSLRITRKTV